VHESLHAADGPSLDPVALGALPPDLLPRLVLTLHPAARCLESSHPVLAIWEANQPGRDGAPDRHDGADRVLVRRVEWDAVPVLVDDAAWALLEAFGRRLTLEQARAALGRDEEFGPALERLAGWGALGGHAIAA
jgi:hypothetical protein